MVLPTLPGLPAGPVLSPEQARESAVTELRRLLGWHVAPVVINTLAVDVPVGRSQVQLPSLRVSKLVKVLNDAAEDVTDRCAVHEDGTFFVPKRGSAPFGYQRFLVTLEHGYEEAPALAQVVLQLSARLQVGTHTVARQSIQGASVDYARDKNGVPLGAQLFQGEWDSVAHYEVRTAG